MNPLHELIVAREKRVWLRSERAFYLKLFLIIFSVTLLPLKASFTSMVLLLLVSTAAILSAKMFRLYASVVLVYALTVFPISLISYLSGNSLERILSTAVYTFNTLMSFVLFISTTDNATIERKFKLKLITYAFSFIYFLLAQLNSILEAFESRGYKISLLRPWSAVPVLLAFSYVIVEKADSIAESAESRGYG